MKICTRFFMIGMNRLNGESSYGIIKRRFLYEFNENMHLVITTVAPVNQIHRDIYYDRRE